MHCGLVPRIFATLCSYIKAWPCRECVDADVSSAISITSKLLNLLVLDATVSKPVNALCIKNELECAISRRKRHNFSREWYRSPDPIVPWATGHSLSRLHWRGTDQPYELQHLSPPSDENSTLSPVPSELRWSLIRFSSLYWFHYPCDFVPRPCSVFAIVTL